MGEIPHSSSSAPGQVRPAQPARAPASPAGTQPASPAFEALLERLTARAAELEQKSKALESPAQLPDAVDAARASLEEALTLGQRLLEAYRASRQTDGTGEVEP